MSDVSTLPIGMRYERAVQDTRVRIPQWPSNTTKV